MATEGKIRFYVSVRVFILLLQVFHTPKLDLAVFGDGDHGVQSRHKLNALYDV